MTDNDKNLKVLDDIKNRKVPISRKEAIQHYSGHPRHNPYCPNATESSKCGNRTYGKTDFDVPIPMTKRLSGIITKKGPKIHESGRKVHADKRCVQQFSNAASKTEGSQKIRTKQEKKYSKVLVSDEKSSIPVYHKQQPALKTNRNTVINDSNNKSKKIPCVTNRNISLSKAKEVLCKNILPLAERGTQREYKEKECYGIRGESSRSASKELEKVNLKLGNHCMKKYSEKVNAKDKIRIYNKQTNNDTDNLQKTKKTKKINSQQIIEVEKIVHKKIVCHDIDADKKGNGAARTRIFKHKKSSPVDKNLTDCKDRIHEREAECSINKFGIENPLLAEKQKRDHQENKTSDSSKHNCEQEFIDSTCNIKNDNIISLYDGGLATPESSTHCSQHQEFDETFHKLVGERANNSFSLTTSSKTCCKQTLSENTEIGLIKGNVSTFSDETEVYWNTELSKEDKPELMTDSTKISDHEYEEIKKSRAGYETPSVSRDEITYHTNLMNYGYDSDQRYCKQSDKQYRKCSADAATQLVTVENNQSTVTDDAKYNLMKALIQPVNEIHDFTGTDNNIRKLLTSGHGSERVLTCRNEGLQNYYINSSDSSSLIQETPNVLNNLRQSKDNTNQSESCETWNPHTSTIYVKQPSSNTSDYIALNSKIKGCKYTKKYRHFKHEEKNMCCNMARYIDKMVSDERKNIEFEKLGNLEREEVKITIDENSPKTSKIRIVNDRSSVSVVCHSLGRTLSSSGKKHTDALASKAESSGGESSGYRSFHNNSNMKNYDTSDWIQSNSKEQHEIKHSSIIISHDRDKLNTDIKYSSNDAKNYLSTFANCMDVYLPCEITAYQFEERNRNKIFQSNNKELVETDIDKAEQQTEKYLTDQDSDTKDESSEEEESGEQVSSVKDFTTTEDQVIMLKNPDHLDHASLELVIDERLLEPDPPEVKNDSIEIPAIPAHHRIVTSLLDVKSEELPQSSEQSITASHTKFTIDNNASAIVVESNNNDIQSNPSNTTFSPVPLVPQVTTKGTYKKVGILTPRTTCLGRSKNKKNKKSPHSTGVHELWTNKKSTVDSTDNNSQSSGRSGCGKCYPKKHDTNKFKCNVFRKLKPSATEKVINVPLDQLPKPPLAFLETTASSQSTIYSSIGNTDASESDIATTSVKKSPSDIAPIHYARKTHRDTISNETINHIRFYKGDRDSITHKDTETDPESSVALSLDEKSFQKFQELQHSAIPPPASALPPPYPFCCPLVPYMMQYWQNNQQPPPPATIPLPEADWKPTLSVVGSEPPPPGMIPIPWFPQNMLHMNNPPLDGGTHPNRSNNLHTQPPPESQAMPRGYAPCLPCSKMPESHLVRTDSLIHEDVEPAVEIEENKQDERKKKVSNKLFKIFRKKNRAYVDTVDEDDKKGRYQQSVARPNNVQAVEKTDVQNLDDYSIWESPDIAGIVTPEEIGRCFRRGFRADGLTLSGDNYLCTKVPSDSASEQEDTFNFSDHDTPLDFLLALGFSVDEATAAIRDGEVRSRFKAALTEARIWVPHIATTQGTLLYLLAMKAKPKVMRYFLQLVESIVNKRITNAVKLDAYLKILEKVEEGYVSFVTLFGKDTGKEDEEDTVIVEKERRRIFYTIYKYAETEAKEVDRELTKASVDLLHSLAARYRPAIGPHIRLLACYIGEGFLTKDVQLEAAVIYLSRLDSAYVHLADLEKYCGLPPSERRRVEQAAKTQS